MLSLIQSIVEPTIIVNQTDIHVAAEIANNNRREHCLNQRTIAADQEAQDTGMVHNIKDTQMQIRTQIEKIVKQIHQLPRLLY